MMQPYTTGGRDARIERLSDQRVREREVPWYTGLFRDDAGGERLVHRVQHSVLADLDQPLDDRQPELAAHDGGDREQSPGRKAQPRDTTPDQLTNPFGKTDIAQRDGRVPVVACTERSDFLEMLQHLDDEQRVAFRMSRHQPRERRRRITADPRLDDVADVIVREPMESDSCGCVFS